MEPVPLLRVVSREVSLVRSRFCQLALSKLNSPVLWAANGPDVFDCSGLVLWALNGVGAKLTDRRAQDLSDQTPSLPPGVAPLPGDLVFYGSGSVEHVAVWLVGGRVLSADGATSRVTSLKAAQANPAARVRLHDDMHYRRDWLSVRRNTFLDALDKVTR